MKFSLEEKVNIPEIEVCCTIRMCRLSNTGWDYFVTYWWEGHLQECWVPESDLEKTNPKGN